MAEVQTRETLFERTLSNLSQAWRDISTSASRSLGVRLSPETAVSDPRALKRLMAECLDGRGGEVSARLRAAALGRAYLQQDIEGRRRFLEVLAREFALDEAEIAKAVAAYQGAEDEEGRARALDRLRQKLVAPRVKLLTQFNILPEGVKFLVDLRTDLLSFTSQDPQLAQMEGELRDLLASWFDVGFLDLRRITWNSPAALLEKLIAYEAVHEIRSWQDLRNRLDSDRRCFALFHPRMPDEPLAFVEVALTREVVGSVQALLDESAPQGDAGKARTAIFYSISNTQKGLERVSFGEHLIKQAVTRLGQELPSIETFVTLSPVPGFRKWLRGISPDLLDSLIPGEEAGQIIALAEADDLKEALESILGRANWVQDEAVEQALKPALLRAAARYFLERRESGEPIDPVARFHLKNGARLERINWLGDVSDKGLKQSAGIMVNYRYDPDAIEDNHEAYASERRVVMSSGVRSLLRGWKDPDGQPLKRLIAARE